MEHSTECVRMQHSRGQCGQHKKKQHSSRIVSFPLPISTVTGLPASDRNWYYYLGVLQPTSVLVTHGGDMNLLYKMVTLSRQIPLSYFC